MLIFDMSPPSFGQNERVMENVSGAGASCSWNAGLSSRIAFANSRTFPRSTGNVTVPRSVPMSDLSAIATSIEDDRRGESRLRPGSAHADRGRAGSRDLDHHDQPARTPQRPGPAPLPGAGERV